MNQADIKDKLTMFKFFDLHKAIANKANKFFNKDGFGIQVEQFPVLMIPYFEGTISQQEIADITSRDKSSILRSVTSLTGKGLVVTATDPFDKRRKLVQLTKEGKKLAEKIALQLIEIDKVVFSCLTAEENETFKQLLQKCRTHITNL